MTSRALTAIGVGQLVNWGILYYAFGVLLLPVARHLHIAPWIVASAFSVALLASAFAAPIVGRAVDRGHGPALMRTGGFASAAVLALWAAYPTIWTLHAVWAALGVCMAAVLYEPAFAIVGRRVNDAARRLRALATITVFGGLASTVFLPLTGWLVERGGWRTTVWVLAAIVAATTALVGSIAFPESSAAAELIDPRTAASHDPHRSEPARGGALGRIVLLFFGTTLASAAFTTNLVPALIERGMPPARSAAVAGLIGIMQLPGRVLLMHRSLAAGPMRLLAVSLALQALGFVVLVRAGTTVMAAAAIAVFAGGAGLSTLVRPYLVLALVGPHRAGDLNGRVARGQQLARAMGPVLAAGLAAIAGYPVVFALFAGMLAVLALASRAAQADSQTA